MDIDVFYSPRHLTFIAVYLTVYADSTFYYRYLEAFEVILPPYHEGGDPEDDYAESILKYQWSEEKVLQSIARSKWEVFLLGRRACWVFWIQRHHARGTQNATELDSADRQGSQYTDE